MKAFEIWKKIIKVKLYTKEEVLKRINVVYAVGQLTDDEYTELIRLIDEVYPEEVAQ